MVFQFQSLVSIKFLKTSGKIFNKVDFDTIKTKNYQSFYEMRADFAWVVHNCKILYSDGSNQKASADRLLATFDEEIRSVEACTNCYKLAYEYPDDSIFMLCDPPHPVIWSKPKSYTIFWPAKCMYLRNGIAHVRYFGDHTMEDVKITNCYMYSKNAPIKAYASPAYLEAKQVS